MNLFAKARRASAGQASVELVAIVPALVICVVIAAHVLPAGWAMWSAANAARAGARAEQVGGDAEAAARTALPPRLREGSRARGDDGIRVTVSSPGLLPGLDPAPVSAASRLDPGDG